MGNSALLIVAAFSMAGASLLYTTQETDVKASQSQSQYDADLIAREIARSAYNAAVADANLEGSDVPAALAAVGTLTTVGCANQVAQCYRREGAMQGGTFRVEASVNGGNGVDIYSRGTYDYTSIQSNPNLPRYGQQVRLAKVHEINEARSVGVLQVARSGRLSIQFIDSSAGYCSAIFMQRTPPGGVPQPLEMVYVPGHNRNGDRNIQIDRTLEPGVQMNFAIGVEMNCTMQNKYFELPNAVWNVAQQRYVHKTLGNPMFFVVGPQGRLPNGLPKGPAAVDSAGVRQFMASHVYNAANWNHTHWALDGGALDQGDPIEAPWGMVETDPNNNQRWRISFEDIHNWNLEPNHARYNDPRYSLWATKRYGYDRNGNGRGDGWLDAQRTVVTAVPGSPGQYRIDDIPGQDGFHDLLDFGDPADFSDQVIMVSIVPATV